jgi:hypothetical protein
MTLVRAEVTHRASDDIPADYCTNTVYHEVDSGIVWGGPDYQNHANELRDAFSGSTAETAAFSMYSDRHIEVRVYDMADAKPRPIKATSDYVPNTPASADDFGPSQVALVLAYYADRNIPSHRGHIYIGPWRVSQTGLYAPSQADMDGLLALGHGLFDIGGENVAHVVYSTKHANTQVIKTYWCDNRWDTQRRRLPKASSRVTLSP